MRKIIVISAFIVLALGVFFAENESVRSVFSESTVRETMIIDPGHGGIDSGAVGVSGVYEKDLNLEISKKICDLFRFCGVRTIMTREEDKSIHVDDAKSIRAKKVSDINERIKLIESFPDARLISVHLNHFSQESCSGAQVFYSDNERGTALAKSVQEKLKTLDFKNKRMPQKAGDNIYLMKNVTCPAILVECGFLSNPSEEEKLKDSNYQKDIAICIVSGYLDVKKEL